MRKFVARTYRVRKDELANNQHGLPPALTLDGLREYKQRVLNSDELMFPTPYRHERKPSLAQVRDVYDEIGGRGVEGLNAGSNGEGDSGNERIHESEKAPSTD